MNIRYGICVLKLVVDVRVKNLINIYVTLKLLNFKGKKIKFLAVDTFISEDKLFNTLSPNHVYTRLNHINSSYILKMRI